jgi:lysophospholipase L1-like esterase
LDWGSPKKADATRLKGIPWLMFRDFDRWFRGQAGTPEARLFSDGVHINAAGYEILGTKLREELLSLMK